MTNPDRTPCPARPHPLEKVHVANGWHRCDACQPAAGPPPLEMLRTKYVVGFDRGSQNGDQTAYVELERQRDGSYLLTRELFGKEAEAEIARREKSQPPAVDVEGLATILAEIILHESNSTFLSDGDKTFANYTGHRCATAAIAYITGAKP